MELPKQDTLKLIGKTFYWTKETPGNVRIQLKTTFFTRFERVISTIGVTISRGFMQVL
jgi:hypothetical protein